jgi:alkylation response protein AidB-like acyl-CoA dehydrogenase
MQLDYTDEQKEIKAELGRFLRQNCSSDVVRRVLEGDEPDFDRGLWRGLGKLGWLSSAIPQDYGGLGLSQVVLCAVAEEIGRALAPVPTSSSIFLAAEALLRFGDAQQKKQRLPQLATGEKIATFALWEGPGALRPQIAAHVQAGRLDGVKVPVSDGMIADWAVVVVVPNPTSNSCLYLVDLDQPAIDRQRLSSLESGRPFAQLTFRSALAEPLVAATGPQAIDALLERAAILAAFEQIGGATRALENAVAFAKERYAFGRPIGSFQAIKHKLANVYMQVELARSNAYYAAWALDSCADDVAIASCVARISATRAFELAARELVHVHGGIGMTRESDCHLFYRRSRQLAGGLGGVDDWRNRLIDLLTIPPPKASASPKIVADSTDDGGFRQEARDWLASNAPRFASNGHAKAAEAKAAACAWQAHKADAGFAAFTWPMELGGRGSGQYQQVVFAEEESKYPVPPDLAHGGIDVVMTTLMRFGHSAQYKPFLDSTRRGDTIWTILFSEPSAGSDVSAARLSAMRDGDDWILNGQKTWCSGASNADWGFLLARTDAAQPKHRGLSCFILDMHSPGINVQPIRFIEGEMHEFAEVFLADVRVANDQLIGEQGDGWRIFLSTLAIDRFGASAQKEISGVNFDWIFNLARNLPGAAGPRIDEGAVRQRLANYYADIRGVENLRSRHLGDLARGVDPGPQTAIGKLILATGLQEMAASAMDMLGPLGIASGNSSFPQLDALQAGYFTGAALRIGAGTDEIIRNIIGERVLGLPSEPQNDRNTPFNQLARSGS